MKEINLLKNNENKDLEDFEWIDDFYEFLQGKNPNITQNFVFPPKLDPKTAFDIIYYLQEYFPILPDTIEQCSMCLKLYDDNAEGSICDGCYEHFCGHCDYELKQCSTCGNVFCEKCQSKYFTEGDFTEGDICIECKEKEK